MFVWSFLFGENSLSWYFDLKEQKYIMLTNLIKLSFRTGPQHGSSQEANHGIGTFETPHKRHDLE
jgi:hypothetical protein